jgi:glycosyltransferase involved in cell wall biosynthesis
MAADWIACHCAHRVVCVSPSVRDVAVAAGILPQDRSIVFGAGSSNGVDQERFRPTEKRLRRAAELRKSLGIHREAPLVGFVGRLTRDKGVSELYEAHKFLRREFPGLKLLFVGDYEGEDPLPFGLQQEIAADPSVIRLGWVDDASDFYHVIDLLALPSHREGFPNVVLEAQAAGRPVVAAKATGTKDAIQHGLTGLLVSPGDAMALAAAIGSLLRDPAAAAALGAAGRSRVVSEFNQERIWAALAEEYSRLLHGKGLPGPKHSEIRALEQPKCSQSLMIL